MTFTPVRALLLLVVLFSAGLASLWLDAQGYWKYVYWTPPAALVPDITPVTTATNNSPTTSFDSIQARPLFAPDRRPPPPPAPPAPPPPPDPLADIQLYGVFSGSSAGIIARVEGKMRRVKINDTLGAWTLQQVENRTATFIKGGETRQVKLGYAALGPRTPTAAPPAGSGAGAAPAGATAPTGTAAAAQSGDDEVRDRLRRRNEIRAARGLPMITQ